MNPVLRTLEDWSTHQDYAWFLVVLAWAGVIAAEFRRKETPDGPFDTLRAGPTPNTWLIALAATQIAGALTELVLLAQDLSVPYLRLDLMMGLAQAGGAFALGWGATAGWRHSAAWRFGLGALLVIAGAGRWWWPLEAGGVLCLAQALAVLSLLRQSPRRISATAGLLLTLAPIVATHGPWAYAINRGRRTTDWSHFALIAATALAAAGAVLAFAAWQRRLKELFPAGTPGEALRRDLKRAVLALGIWLAAGVLFAVWYGRQARRAYEENLLRRVEILALAIDPQALAQALGPELRITRVTQRRYASGNPVEVATLPRTREPVYVALRARLKMLRERNPDLRHLSLMVARGGHLVVLGSEPRTDAGISHIIHHDPTPEDLERIASRVSFLEGPTRHPSLGAKLSVRVPLLHPTTGKFLGWLAAEVDSARWAMTFVQARLQTMTLVAVGVGLWTLAVAYRLRREARDAAEQRAAAADAADRMKSGFLAKVSHELRTPIQSVLGYGELLATAPLSEQHRSWLAALRSHGDIMLRLVNDLIDLGALQSGAFRLEPGAVALRTLVEECAASLRPAAAAKGLAFQLDLSPTLPPWVRADGVRLRQILLNLLTNAVKYTPAGRISLSVQTNAAGNVLFIVSDTGPGIPPTLRSRLFQPFARLDPAAGGGSGLGLALVQGICGVCGGTVQLADSTGPGATFVVELPLTRCDAPDESFATAKATQPGFAGLRVLIAEDNTLVRELLMAFLAENGAEVTVVGDGLAALALAQERAPDVLLLDIALPGLDGIGVAKQLRRDGPRRIRIIGLSAHAGAQDEARARAAGMDVFLAKPVRLAQLADALRLMQPARAHAPLGDFAVHIADASLQSRLATQFARETPRVLAELRLALAMTDWARVRSRAHYLKNSADVIGATGLQDACHRLASLDESPEPAAAQKLLAAVEAAIPGQLAVYPDAPAEGKN